MPSRVSVLTFSLALLGACLGACVAPEPTGIPALGNGRHDASAIVVTTIVGPEAVLEPTDVAIRPDAPAELWVTLRQDDAIVIVDAVDTDARTATRYDGYGNVHFMPRPSALAFGEDGRMATSHETDMRTQSSTPPDFMGPTLWPTDRELFDGGHMSHLDMLHNSPNGVGIAWETGNAYWVVDGYHRSLTRYDFATDHGPGNEDHSDGIVARYVEGQLGYVEDVPAHAVLDHATSLLYVADPGNARIAALDIRTGTRGAAVMPNYDGTDQYAMDGAVLTTVIDGTVAGLLQPSGVAIHEGLLYVSDHRNSTVAAFDLATYALVDWVDLSRMAPEGSLGGIDVDAQGRIYVADLLGSRVLRLSAP